MWNMAKEPAMQDYEYWMDLITNDLDSWDAGTLKAHLDIEGVAEDVQSKILKARLSLCESGHQPSP
jgi:hypothetical protein